MERIPVTLLTGFLGSGKSTLLTQLLQDSKFCDTAVVVNEFGEVGLDGILIEHNGEQIVEMTSGVSMLHHSRRYKRDASRTLRSTRTK